MTVLAAIVALTCSAEPSPTHIGVTDFRAQPELASLGSALSGLVANELTRLGAFQVTSARQVADLMTLERQKQLLGCQNDTCLSETAIDLGFDFLVSGTLTKFAGSKGKLTLELMLLDPKAGKRIGSQVVEGAANLRNLAADANAGVEYLLTRPEIDAQRIGLIGGSQAGWLIPIAVAESEHVSFFVIISGPVASTLQENIFSNYTNDGESSENYDDEVITRKLRSLGFGGFNPIPYLAESTQPGLWLWGGVDKSVPVTFSRENLQVLIDGGKNNFEYLVFPSSDHGLNVTPNGLFSEMPYSPGLALYGTLMEWLAKNNISAKE